MREVRWVTEASPEAVWSVLADGWLYPTWVVGASRMRSVDAGWPKAGARLRHSFGVWPAVIDDVSEVLESAPPGLLVIRAGGWPLGEATVRITIAARGGGASLTMAEDATRGPGTLVPKPLRQLVIAVRNREALHRLALTAEGRPPA